MKESKNPFLSAAAAVALAIILITSAAVTSAHAQTFTVLYNFGGVSGDPRVPYYGPIAQGRDGNLYATTLFGGSTDSGTVFKITPSGILTVLSSLGGDAGDSPFGGLTLARDGNFYGTNFSGTRNGTGSVFGITPDGRLKVLYVFSNGMKDGGNPYAPPIQGAGNLYGTTANGGDANFGTLYKIIPPGHLTTVYSFTDKADGASPHAALLQATDGNFYGTAGTAFKISPTGIFTNLGLLPATSYAPLLDASNGHLYGVTFNGGIRDWGTVFEMSRTGTTRVLHSFKSAYDGANPSAGLIQASDGTFYGTTVEGGPLGYGTIYSINSVGNFSVLHSFEEPDTQCWTSLFQHTNGILYGETAYRGLYDAGTFFSLDVGAPPFIRLVTTFGTAGQTIGILGQGFTGTTDVSFNGIPATFTVSSDTYLEAAVPAGATTGFVTVSTSTGTLTSNQQIQIRP